MTEFKAGDRVRVKVGAMAGKEGVIVPHACPSPDYVLVELPEGAAHLRPGDLELVWTPQAGGLAMVRVVKEKVGDMWLIEEPSGYFKFTTVHVSALHPLPAPALSAEDAAVLREAERAWHMIPTGTPQDEKWRALNSLWVAVHAAIRARTPQEPAMPEVQGAPGPEIAGLERAVVEAALYQAKLADSPAFGPADGTHPYDVAVGATNDAARALRAARTPPVVDRVAELREAAEKALSRLDWAAHEFDAIAANGDVPGARGNAAGARHEADRLRNALAAMREEG